MNKVEYGKIVECLKGEMIKALGCTEPIAIAYAAALAGAENTKNMPAIRGRAFYQADKGVGHLDPGAVTMSYQIEELMKLIKEKIV